jgi:hypothetical protein
MKKQAQSACMGSLFGPEDMPPPPVSAPGGLSCRAEIAHAMSDALKGHDRYEIAAKMSKLLGREISKHILDAYTAESREDHIPPLDTAIAFDLATESRVLAELFAHKIGAKLAVGKEAMDAKLGQLERMREEIARQIKIVKKNMGDYDE